MIKLIMDNFSLNNGHTLVLVNTRLTGEEEWVCPICGHRLLKTQDPQHALEILVPGDEPLFHDEDCYPAAFKMSAEALNQLAPWVSWINQVDFDSLEAEVTRPNS